MTIIVPFGTKWPKIVVSLMTEYQPHVLEINRYVIKEETHHPWNIHQQSYSNVMSPEQQLRDKVISPVSSLPMSEDDLAIPA
jgi:hypothetical protein